MKEASLRKLIAWGLSLILAWAFLYQGLQKLIPQTAEEYQMKFIEWGYEPQFAIPIGIVEIIAGILVLVPRTAILGAFVAIVVMSGAAFTHWSTGVGKPTFAIMLLIISIAILIMRWPDSFLQKRAPEGIRENQGAQ